MEPEECPLVSPLVPSRSPRRDSHAAWHTCLHRRWGVRRPQRLPHRRALLRHRLALRVEPDDGSPARPLDVGNTHVGQARLRRAASIQGRAARRPFRTRAEPVSAADLPARLRPARRALRRHRPRGLAREAATVGVAARRRRRRRRLDGRQQRCALTGRRSSRRSSRRCGAAASLYNRCISPTR